MTLWAVLTTPDVPWSRIEPRIGEHLDYQQRLVDAGALLAAGPFLGDDGRPAGRGLTLLRADTREQAEALAVADPLILAGLRSSAVHRWRVAQSSGETPWPGPGQG